jgi:hypothetical protein
MNLSNLAETKRILREGVEKGYWTLDALDRPSPGFVTCTHVDRETFPGGYEGIQHRNLLKAQGIPHPETVQVIDNKDLPPMRHGVTPAQDIKLPITLDEEKGLNPLQERTTDSADQCPHEPDELQPVAGSSPLPWE